VWLCQVAAKHWRTLADEPWPAVGMAGVPSTTVRFDGAPMALLGTRDEYLQRPGFWHGGAGIAAVWFGAAAALAERMRPAAPRGIARDYWVKWTSPGPAAALLREVAARIDAAPESAHREEVVRLRCVVERAATRVLDLAGAHWARRRCAWRCPCPSLRGPDRVPSAEPRRPRLGMAGRPAGDQEATWAL
jgi:hypothetical protein